MKHQACELISAMKASSFAIVVKNFHLGTFDVSENSFIEGKIKVLRSLMEMPLYSLYRVLQKR